MISKKHQSRGYGWPSHSVRGGLYIPGKGPAAAPPAWAGNSHLSFRRSGWLPQLPVSNPKTRPDAMLFRPQWDPPRTETAASLRDEKCSDLSVAKSTPSRRKSPQWGCGDRPNVTVGLSQYFSVVSQSDDRHFRLIMDMKFAIGPKVPMPSTLKLMAAAEDAITT
jgi:hypothetical protein